MRMPAAVFAMLLVAGVAAPAHATFYHVWSEAYSDTAGQFGEAVGVGPDGSVYVAGSFAGSIDVGGQTLTNDRGDGIADTFMARLDSRGRAIWTKVISHGPAVRGLEVDALGDAIIAGDLYGSADFGGGVLTSAGGSDIYVAKFGPNGTFAWSKRFGSPQQEDCRSVAVDADGSIVLTGQFFKRVDFGGGDLIAHGGGDAFLAKLTGSGDHVWSQRFGDTSQQDGKSVAVTLDGHIAFYMADSPRFLGYFDGEGALEWSHGYSSAWIGTPQLTTDPDGGLIIAGVFQDALDVGGATLVAPPQASLGFLLSLDAGGVYRWSAAFGDADGTAFAAGLAIDAGSNLFMVGTLVGKITLDGTELAGPDRNLLLLQFDPSGHLQDSRILGKAYASDVTLGADAFVVVGSYTASVDLGGATALPYKGGTDAFAAAYSLSDPNYSAIAAFSATLHGAMVDTRWQLASGEPLDTYRLMRRSDIDPSWTTIATGNATGTQGYDDATVVAGHTYDYQLFVTTSPGGEYASAIATVLVPSVKTALLQNAPNPFVWLTEIPYTIDSTVDVTIDIFDVTGRRVVRLHEGERGPGAHTAAWDGRDAAGRLLASGVYFYRFGAGGTGVKKMILVR